MGDCEYEVDGEKAIAQRDEAIAAYREIHAVARLVEEERDRLRRELVALRLHVVELARLSGHPLLDDVADDIAAILRGDNHE